MFCLSKFSAIVPSAFGALLAGSVAAVAQTLPVFPAGSADMALKSAPTQDDWTKACSKNKDGNEYCYTTRDFVSERGETVMAVAVYEHQIGAERRRSIRVLLPLGLQLFPGIRVSVDDGQQVGGQFGLCLPAGCFAEGVVRDDFLSALKRGSILNVSAQNQDGRDLRITTPLAGFGKAFDGPATEPAVLAEQKKKLQAELKRRSDALRQRVDQGSGSVAPAPLTPPAAPK